MKREGGLATHSPIISPTLLEGIINSTTSCPASGTDDIIKGDGCAYVGSSREKREEVEKWKG